MARIHPHDDPYFPNEGNAGWLEEEPEDNHPIPLDDHHAEGFSDGSDSESEVENLPLVTPVRNPNPRRAFQVLTRPWVESLETWSQEKNQPMPFNGD